MLLLPATLTSREARDTLRMLGQALRSADAGTVEASNDPVVVDASRLQQLDTSALAVLLELDRLARAWGRGFAVRAAPPKLEALAHLYGVDTFLLHGSPAGGPAQRSPAA